MGTVDVSQLGPLAARIRNGETVQVFDDGRLVATLVPATNDRLDSRMRELEARGAVRRIGTGEAIPPEFYTDELPRVDGESVVDELIRAREED
jgi:antitoxin (DNA-binding transcriptional repressor) of toxin-antitoxin stability system